MIDFFVIFIFFFFKALIFFLKKDFKLSVANFIKVMLLDFHGTPFEEALPIALVVSVPMLATVIIAKLIGCLLPLLADKIGFDPAVMASPFITTIVDAVSLLVYFAIANNFIPSLI